MSNLIERQHLDPEEGDALVIPKSFRHRDMGECALNIGDTDVADTIMGHLSGDPAENRATLALDDAFRSILDATAAIRERPTMWFPGPLAARGVGVHAHRWPAATGVACAAPLQ